MDANIATELCESAAKGNLEKLQELVNKGLKHILFAIIIVFINFNKRIRY